jgi:hypothetical protein
MNLKKIRIGVVGENKSDIKAIANLLKQRFDTQIELFQMLKNMAGAMLDQDKGYKAADQITLEFDLYKPNFVLYIRDLDDDISNRVKLDFRLQNFDKIAQKLPQKAIFMLNVYEIEALILADFESLKTVFHLKTDYDSDTASSTQNPKEVLNTFLPKAKNTDLFTLINIERVAQNHRFFAAFLIEFEKMIHGKTFQAKPLR